MSFCTKCEGEFKDDDVDTECDRCGSLFHMTCIRVTKSELAARKKSKCLRLYCEQCIEFKDNIEDHLKMVLKFVHKLDMKNQEQSCSHKENSERLDKLVKNSDAIVAKFDECIANKATVTAVGNPAGAPTYASVVKKPVVVIRPKHKQDSK